MLVAGPQTPNNIKETIITPTIEYRIRLNPQMIKISEFQIKTWRNRRIGTNHIYSETDGKRVKELLDKQDKLATAWNKSLCVCSLCGSRTSDMTFNTDSKGWFYVKCYEKARRFYKRKAKEGEIWFGEDFHKTPSTEWWP